ncbi:MAG: Gfo/Idh/MocA family oxidoreductase [Pseudomonadota bacterium]
MDPLRIGIVGAQFVAHLHMHNYARLRGWNFASPDEDWVRGYPQELEDFVECLLTGREPDSGLDLACQTVEAIYAAYLSAEKGMRVELEKRPPLTA